MRAEGVMLEGHLICLFFIHSMGEISCVNCSVSLCVLLLERRPSFLPSPCHSLAMEEGGLGEEVAFWNSASGNRREAVLDLEGWKKERQAFSVGGRWEVTIPSIDMTFSDNRGGVNSLGGGTDGRSSPSIHILASCAMKEPPAHAVFA